MLARFVAALIALVCLCLAPSPVAAAHCGTVDAILAEANDAAAKIGGEVIQLAGKEATDYLAVINASPPETSMAAEAMIIVVVPGRGAQFALVKDGKACLAMRIDLDVHEKAMKAAKGAPA